MKHKLTNFEHAYLFTCISIIAIGCIVLAYWLWYPNDNIQILSVKVAQTEYHPGDRLEYSLEYCKDHKMPAQVVRSLVNGTQLTFTTIISDLPVGCNTVTVTDLIIPDYVDEGVYHLEGTGTSYLNPIRQDMNFWKTSEFIITK